MQLCLNFNYNHNANVIMKRFVYGPICNLNQSNSCINPWVIYNNGECHKNITVEYVQ